MREGKLNKIHVQAALDLIRMDEEDSVDDRVALVEDIIAEVGAHLRGWNPSSLSAEAFNPVASRIVEGGIGHYWDDVSDFDLGFVQSAFDLRAVCITRIRLHISAETAIAFLKDNA